MSMVFSIAHAFSIIKAAWITGFFLFAGRSKNRQNQWMYRYKGHLILIKTKPFCFKKLFKLNIFFSEFVTITNGKDMNLQSAAVHKLFTCKVLPGKAWTNHKLGMYSPFRNCRQNVRIQLCTNVINTLYMTNNFLICAFFHYFFLFFLILILLFSYCPCTVCSSMYANSEIRSFMHLKAKGKNCLLCLSISGIGMICTIIVWIGLYF